MGPRKHRVELKARLTELVAYQQLVVKLPTFGFSPWLWAVPWLVYWHD